MNVAGSAVWVRLVVALLVVVSLCACAAQRTTEAQRPPMLQAAATRLLAGEYDQAVISYTDFLATGPSSALLAEAYVGRGNAYFKLARYELAEADFRSALNVAADRNLKAQATMGLANSLFAQDRYDAAEKLYRQILKAYVGLVPQDEVTYRLALSVARQGRWQEASEFIDELSLSWPSGEFAKRARARRASISGRAFTVQVGAFSNRSMAEITLKDLQSKGFPGSIDPIDMDGVPGFAVRSGRFPAWPEATAHAEKLERAGFSTYKLP